MSTEAHDAAVEAVADKIFGPEVTEEQPTEEPTEEPVEEEYEPDPKPVVEGEEVEATDEEDDPDPIVEFEWNGQIIEAPTSIKESLMLQQDYTQKTQGIATQRKELEVRAENLAMVNAQYEYAQSIQEDVLQAHELQQQISQAQTYLRNNVGQGEELTATQIEQFRLAIDESKEQLNAIVNGIQSKNTEFQQAQEQTRKELLDKSTEVLRQKIPGWGTDQEDQIKAYALDQGVPEQTYQAIVDPLEKVILYKAMQYDALQSAKPAAVKTVQAAPTIKTKSRNPMPKDTQDKLNLRKKIKNPNKSHKEKASLIGEDIAKRFKM